MTDTRTPAEELRKRVAIAMRNVYIARMPKYSGASCYPLEEFLPEAECAIAVTLKAAELALCNVWHPPNKEITNLEILGAIYSLLPPMSDEGPNDDDGQPDEAQEWSDYDKDC